MTRIDGTLDDRLHTALAGNAHLRGRQLHCEAEQGRITLRGVVHSFYQKQMAQEAIRHLDGVDEIFNQLEVG